jgi:hypothetical protein
MEGYLQDGIFYQSQALSQNSAWMNQFQPVFSLLAK